MKRYLLFLMISIFSCNPATPATPKTEKEIYRELVDYVDGYLDFINLDSLQAESVKKVDADDYTARINQLSARAKLKANYNVALRKLDSAIYKFDSIEYREKVYQKMDSLKLLQRIYLKN